MVESRLEAPDPSKYWWFVPNINYQFMEDPDWQAPNWEEWEHRIFHDRDPEPEVQQQDGAGALLEPRGDLEQNTPAVKSKSSNSRSSGKRAKSSGKKKARNFRQKPAEVSQVNTQRVLDFADLPAGALEQLENALSEDDRGRERPRRSEQAKRKPLRYQT